MHMNRIEPGFLRIAVNDSQIIKYTEFIKFFFRHHCLYGILRSKKEPVHTGIDIVPDKIQRRRCNSGQCMVNRTRIFFHIGKQPVPRQFLQGRKRTENRLDNRRSFHAALCQFTGKFHLFSVRSLKC